MTDLTPAVHVELLLESCVALLRESATSAANVTDAGELSALILKLRRDVQTALLDTEVELLDRFLAPAGLL